MKGKRAGADKNGAKIGASKQSVRASADSVLAVKGKDSVPPPKRQPQKRQQAAVATKQESLTKFKPIINQSSTWSKNAGNKYKEISSPRGSMFNDISSIDGANQDVEILVDEQVDFRYRAITREACMLSIPLSVQILHDLVDKLVEQDQVKEVQARERALKLSVAQAWIASQSFQFFNDKRKGESMTEKMKEDILDAEIEPTPAAPDVLMGELKKVRVKIRPVKIESKWQVPQRLMKKRSLRLHNNHVSPYRQNEQSKRKRSSEDSSLVGGEIYLDASGKAKRTSRAQHFSTQKHLTVLDFNQVPGLYPAKSLQDEGSDIYNASFSVKESRQFHKSKSFFGGKFKESPQPQVEPVHLRDMSDYVSSGSEDLEISDGEWSEVAHKKKKTIRARNRVKNKGEDDKKLTLRTVPLTQEKRHTTGAQYYKDNDVGLAQRQTEAQIQASLAAHEARIKAQQVKFNYQVPALVEEEAPGFPVSMPQNKKHKRLIVKKPLQESPKKPLKQKTATNTLSASNQANVNQQKWGTYEASIDQQQTSLRLAPVQFSPDYLGNQDYGSIKPAVSKMAYKSVKTILDNSKQLNYSSQMVAVAAENSAMLEKPADESLNQSSSTLQNSMVVSKDLKDAFLRKLQKIDKQGNRKKLMPSGFMTDLVPNPSMMTGTMQPYQIKQIDQSTSSFRIDMQTYNISPSKLNEQKNLFGSVVSGGGDIQQNSLQGSASRLQLTVRGRRSHSSTDLFDQMNSDKQRSERTNFEIEYSGQSKKEYAAAANKRSVTQQDQNNILFPSIKTQRLFKPIGNMNVGKRKKSVVVRVENQDETQMLGDKSIDDHKNHLSIIQQRADESENVSPELLSKSKRFDRGSGARHQIRPFVLPPLGTKHLGTAKSLTQLRGAGAPPASHDRVKVNKSSSVPQLLNFMESDRQGALQSGFSSNILRSDGLASGNTPKAQAGTGINLLGRVNSQPTLQAKYSTTNFTSLRSGGASSQVFSFGRNVTAVENVPSASQRTLHKTARIQNHAKPNGFTEKVQIKNVELTKRLADGMESPKISAKNRGNRHGLMNVLGGGNIQGQNQYSNLKVLLDRGDPGQTASRQDNNLY